MVRAARRAEAPAPAETTPTSNGRFSLQVNGPTGDWSSDIDRPPLGSLASMLFRSLVDRVQFHIAEQGGKPTRPAHLYILRSLYPDGASVTELAERCEVTKQAISQVLVSLEAMKLVKRTPDPRDGRGKVVTLTKQGQNALAAAVRAWGEVEREWAELLGGQEAMHQVREAMFAFIETYGDWHRGDRPRLRPVW